MQTAGEKRKQERRRLNNELKQFTFTYVLFIRISI